MKLLFLDESGNHALDSIDPDYPVFLLGGVIIDRAYYREEVSPRVRDRFYQAVNELMRDLDYTVIACVIKKPEHVAQYGRHALDPYMYSLDIIVERFCRVVGPATDGAMIFAEKRSPVLDHQLDIAWETLKSVGTDYVGRSAIDDRVVDLSLKDKRLNIAGLQLADLVVSPIGRAVMGKPTREDWEIVKGKLRRGPKGYEGYGLVIRP